MSGFQSPLIFKKLEGKQFQLTAPLIYQVTADKVITVPAGFVTDLASIPRVFYISTPPIGDYDMAAVVHDFLYTAQVTTRAQADGIFKQAMQDCGVGWYTRTKMYLAVRMFGGKIWDAYARDDQEAA